MRINKTISLFFNNTLNFDYGNLTTKYPTETFNQIKQRRKNNFSILKAICDLKKSNGIIYLPSERIEVYLEASDKISLNEVSNDTLSIFGTGQNNTSIVCYPYVPIPNINQNLFTLEYNTTLSIENLTIERDYIKKYETYSCVLKKSGNAKLIEISAVTIRPEFWQELEVGQYIFYAWEIGVIGESNTISSWDSVAKTITLTNNIGGSVSNDQPGDVGVRFKEDISESDYLTYGNQWYLNEGMNCIYSIPVANTSDNDTIINLTNASISGFETNISISSGACKINMEGVELSRCQLGLSFFSRDQANSQMISYDNLTFDDCGYSIAGGIFTGTAGNILGSGCYSHPNIQVRKINEGTLYLTNNIAAAFRQFSSSGEKPVGVGYYSEFGQVFASNNTEYDIYTSNSMPTTIDYIESSNVVNCGGNLVISDGQINNFRTSTQLEPDAGDDIIITLNSCEITGDSSFAFSGSVNSTTTVNFNDCTFTAIDISDLPVLIKCETSFLKELNINGGSVIKGSTGSYYTEGGVINGLTSCSSLIRKAKIKEINITNFVTERLFGYLITSGISDNTFEEKAYTITFTDCDLLYDRIENLSSTFSQNLSYKFTGIRVKLNSSGLPGYIWNQRFKPKTGTLSNHSVINSSYLQFPFSGVTAFSNVLELNWDYKTYDVNTGTVNTIAPILYYSQGGVLRKCISTNMIDEEIIINAIGGNVIFNQWDSVTNNTSNILNSYTCLSSQSCKLVPNGENVLSTGANSNVNKSGGTGDGITKIFKGIFTPDTDKLIVPNTASLTAGAISGSIDSDGLITGTGIVNGFIDLYGGAFYVEFTVAPSVATDIAFEYDIYNGWKFTGSWTIVSI